MSRADYGLAVIGSGPAGQRAAIQAAKHGWRACVIDRHHSLGGVSLNRGTIPSKTVREAIIYLTGLDQRGFYGPDYHLKEDISLADLRARIVRVIEREQHVVADQLQRNGVTIVEGTARFLDRRSVGVTSASGETTITADAFVIATGSRPARPPGVPFERGVVIDSDGLLHLERMPSSVVVVGAGVIGTEFASMFAALGRRTCVVDGRHDLLGFCDPDVQTALQRELEHLGVDFRLGEQASSIETSADGGTVRLSGGSTVEAELVLYAAGRIGATEELDLAAIGLTADDRGHIPVDASYRTAAEHIYAVGDVIGFPALAATSAEQGRIAAAHLIGAGVHDMDPLLPVGIYSIPELSYAGRTEPELQQDGTAYVSGRAAFRELARGQIIGELHGMLKLLVNATDRRLLGVHIVGAGATELVHIGQTAMIHGATVDDLVDQVFNYPTLAEAYKVAALDAANRLRSSSESGAERRG